MKPQRTLSACRAAALSVTPLPNHPTTLPAARAPAMQPPDLGASINVWLVKAGITWTWQVGRMRAPALAVVAPPPVTGTARATILQHGVTAGIRAGLHSVSKHATPLLGWCNKQASWLRSGQPG